MGMAAESHSIQKCPNAHSLNFLLYLSHIFAIEAFLLYLPPSQLQCHGWQNHIKTTLLAKMLSN